MHDRSRNAVTCLLVLVAILAVFSSGPLAIVKPLFGGGCDFTAAFGNTEGHGTVYTSSVVTDYWNSFVGPYVTVSGMDNCEPPADDQQWVNVWSASCDLAKTFSAIQDGIAWTWATNWASESPARFMSALPPTDASSSGWSASFMLSDIPYTGQPTADWCITDTQVLYIVLTCDECTGIGWELVGTRFLPLTITFWPPPPESSSSSSSSSLYLWTKTLMFLSTTTSTGAWISPHTGLLTWSASSSSSSTAAGFPWPILSASSTSGFTVPPFQTLPMPGSSTTVGGGGWCWWWCGGSPSSATLATTATTSVIAGATASLQTSASTVSPITATSPGSGVFITANQAAPTSSSTQAAPSLIGMLSQTDLLLVGAIVVLIAFIAVTMLRRRKPSGRSTSQGVRTGVIYCEHCGAKMEAADKFCEKCGAKPVD